MRQGLSRAAQRSRPQDGPGAFLGAASYGPPEALKMLPSLCAVEKAPARGRGKLDLLCAFHPALTRTPP
jgi:hypothetical protein